MTLGASKLLDGLFRRHARELQEFVRPRSGRFEAEDVVQETYLRLLQRGRPDTVRNARAFLYKTASHLLADRARRARRRDFLHTPGVDPDTLYSAAPESAAPELDRALESAWQFEDLLGALEELPAICRHAFLLNKLDGLTHPEIAERLGISQKTAQRHILRAWRHCNARLGR